ncbi:tetratricopeptide repeat protein [Pontibacillus litoralis]|uniref:Uncharacterized protein n=1 Tax=Pontibacillus litoralis JSM 072002 TaxID=1385512 RepID=A0A0A5G4B6_9BACI|nr:tetratricopeptide repeat protein [Pontibacillus litoralis]KGX87956.1 hypothetical protein N784_12730 [Pontibacillus litoralis JSM 072002]
MQGLEQAIQLMNDGKAQQAIERLRAEQPRANEEEKFTIAQLFLQWGMTDDAEEILYDLKQTYPEEYELTLLLADIYIDKEQDELAIDLLNEIPPDQEEYLSALVQLADLYQAQGLHEVAEQKLFLAKNIAPEEPVIDFALAELSFSNGEYKTCIPYYERALRRHSSVGEAEIPLRLAEAHAMLGEYEQSLDYFQATSDYTPDVLFRYGFTAYRAERNDIAIRVWKKLMEEDPFYQSVYGVLAEALELDGQIEEAYQTAIKGIRKDEFNKDLYVQAGKLAFRLQDKREGYKLIRQAISLDPGYKEAIIFIVERLKEDGDYEAIKDLLEHVREMDEEDPLYVWELARANNELEYYKEALNGYEVAYNSFKEDSEFLKEFGYFLVEEGNPQKAYEMLNRYVEIEPTDEEVQVFMARLHINEED